MNKALREALREIARAGGTGVEVRHGSKHIVVTFAAPDGTPRTVTLSSGARTKYREGRVRSQIRNERFK